jgi:hypothetical protein
MSPQFKSDAAFSMNMLGKAALIILGFLASYTFWEIKNSISEIKYDLKNMSTQMSTDVNGLNTRLIRVEIKLENALDTAKEDENPN